MSSWLWPALSFAVGFLGAAMGVLAAVWRFGGAWRHVSDATESHTKTLGEHGERLSRVEFKVERHDALLTPSKGAR